MFDETDYNTHVQCEVLLIESATDMCMSQTQNELQHFTSFSLSIQQHSTQASSTLLFDFAESITRIRYKAIVTVVTEMPWYADKVISTRHGCKQH